MKIAHRQYQLGDFEIIGEFLIRYYQPGNRDGNWLQPTWEYMHSHPALDEASLDRIRIWKRDGEVIGIVHYESKLGEAFFQLHPDFYSLKGEMLEYAEVSLFGESEAGEKYLRAFVNDTDEELRELVMARGYRIKRDYSRPMYQYSIPHPVPQETIPDGFAIKSLADENNLRKIHRVLWRGFNHEGEPPEEGIEDRKKMQSTPNFREDLTIVVEAPSGDFVSFCGMWFEPVNKIAYVEPVASDPDFRRMGLGKAAVLEGIRRCEALGATVAFVGSGLEFYKSIGFKKSFGCDAWEKYF